MLGMKTKLAVAFISTLVALAWFGGQNIDNAFAKPSAKTSGSFVKKTYKVKGQWNLVKDGDKRFIELSADFKTKQGPDLKVFLSPTSLGNVTNKNAEKGSVFVGRLPSHKGKQRIEIPEGTELSKYSSILIHCQQYTVLFAASSLR